MPAAQDGSSSDLIGDPDARHWAERFTACTAIAPGIASEPETMFVWFAAAIETGRMHAARRALIVQPPRCPDHGPSMRLRYSPEHPDGEWLCRRPHQEGT